MQNQAKCQSVNKWGEPIHRVFFTHRSDAQNFTKFIGNNFKRFSIIGCHKVIGSSWAVVYRARKNSPWKGGVA